MLAHHCPCASNKPILISEQRLATTGRSPFVPPNIVEVHTTAPNTYEQQQTSVHPVTRWITLDGLLSLVDPNANDLARRSHRDVEGNSQADGTGGVEVGRQPAQQRRNTGKGTACGDYEASIPWLSEGH